MLAQGCFNPGSTTTKVFNSEGVRELFRVDVSTRVFPGLKQPWAEIYQRLRRSGLRTWLLSVCRHGLDPVDEVPTFFRVFHAVFAGGHDAGYAFGDLPEDLAVAHRRDALFVR